MVKSNLDYNHYISNNLDNSLIETSNFSNYSTYKCLKPSLMSEKALSFATVLLHCLQYHVAYIKMLLCNVMVLCPVVLGTF